MIQRLGSFYQLRQSQIRYLYLLGSAFTHNIRFITLHSSYMAYQVIESSLASEIESIFEGDGKKAIDQTYRTTQSCRYLLFI